MDINAYNKIGLTAIHHLCRATYAGQEVMLDYLMSKGAKHKSIDFTGTYLDGSSVPAAGAPPRSPKLLNVFKNLPTVTLDSSNNNRTRVLFSLAS